MPNIINHLIPADANALLRMYKRIAENSTQKGILAIPHSVVLPRLFQAPLTIPIALGSACSYGAEGAYGAVKALVHLEPGKALKAAAEGTLNTLRCLALAVINVAYAALGLLFGSVIFTQFVPHDLPQHKEGKGNGDSKKEGVEDEKPVQEENVGDGTPASKKEDVEDKTAVQEEDVDGGGLSEEELEEKKILWNGVDESPKKENIEDKKGTQEGSMEGSIDGREPDSLLKKQNPVPPPEPNPSPQPNEAPQEKEVVDYRSREEAKDNEEHALQDEAGEEQPAPQEKRDREPTLQPKDKGKQRDLPEPPPLPKQIENTVGEEELAEFKKVLENNPTVEDWKQLFEDPDKGSTYFCSLFQRFILPDDTLIAMARVQFDTKTFEDFSNSQKGNLSRRREAYLANIERMKVLMKENIAESNALYEMLFYLLPLDGNLQFLKKIVFEKLKKERKEEHKPSTLLICQALNKSNLEFINGLNVKEVKKICASFEKLHDTPQKNKKEYSELERKEWGIYVRAYLYVPFMQLLSNKQINDNLQMLKRPLFATLYNETIMDVKAHTYRIIQLLNRDNQEFIKGLNKKDLLEILVAFILLEHTPQGETAPEDWLGDISNRYNLFTELLSEEQRKLLPDLENAAMEKSKAIRERIEALRKYHQNSKNLDFESRMAELRKLLEMSSIFEKDWVEIFLAEEDPFACFAKLLQERIPLKRVLNAMGEAFDQLNRKWNQEKMEEEKEKLSNLRNCGTKDFKENRGYLFTRTFQNKALDLYCLLEQEQEVVKA